MFDSGHCKVLHEGLALAQYANFYDYPCPYTTDADEEVAGAEQVVLPSGIIVDRRSLILFYQHKLSESTKTLDRILAEYRKLGWNETDQEIAARKAKDLHFLKKMTAKLNFH